MSFLRKVDHITYACAQGTIERWAWFHTEVEGGRLITRIDDVRPQDPDSSMKLWCIDFGEFGIEPRWQLYAPLKVFGRERGCDCYGLLSESP